jgi:hypothetical protein
MAIFTMLILPIHEHFSQPLTSFIGQEYLSQGLEAFPLKDGTPIWV